MVAITFTTTRREEAAGLSLRRWVTMSRRSVWKFWIKTALLFAVLGLAISLGTCRYTGAQLFSPDALKAYGLITLLVVAVCTPVFGFGFLGYIFLLELYLTCRNRPELAVRFGTGGAHVTSRDGNEDADIAWSRLGGWVENRSILLLLYPDIDKGREVYGLLLPKRAFASPAEIDRIRARLIDTSVPRHAPLR